MEASYILLSKLSFAERFNAKGPKRLDRTIPVKKIKKNMIKTYPETFFLTKYTIINIRLITAAGIQIIGSISQNLPLSKKKR
jgi:hypothetical protein